MKYYSESFFREVVNGMPLDEQHTYNRRDQGAPSYVQFDIFLSYNIADLSVVKGIYFYLTKKGFRVYLDCIVDPDLNRNSTNKETAERIHNRLKHSTSLIYAQSQGANQSNWMPWELGFIDGHTGKCMIMPVTKDQTTINPQRQYLLLYPYVGSNYYNEMSVFREVGQIRETTIRNYIVGSKNSI